MPETSQLPPVSQPAREESRYPIGKVWIPHPSRVRSVLLIRPDDELSLAISPLSSGRVALPDLRPGGLLRRLPQPARRSMSLIGAGVLSVKRTAQPTCWLQSAPTPESLQSAASTTRCPHYRRLAITDEASPFALRSTRNRPRRAMHQGCVRSRQRRRGRQRQGGGRHRQALDWAGGLLHPRAGHRPRSVSVRPR